MESIIYNADCLTGMRNIPNNSVDCIITDPPYDVNYGDKSKALADLDKAREKQIKRDETYIDNIESYRALAYSFKRILKENSHVYIFCGGKQYSLWYDVMQKEDFKFGNYLVWLKNRQTLDLSFGFNYNYKTELCMYFRKGTRKINNIGSHNVLSYPTGQSLAHPAQKPIEMIKFLIMNSTNENDIVFDPFMGSGTTALACKATNRKYLGYEISPVYFKLIQERLKNTLGRFFENVPD